MIITYKIPSGIMRINADEFFRLARRSAIRRMFKRLRQDDKAAAEYTSQIREHLKRREQEERDEAARLYGELVDAGTQCREAKVRYEEMQNPFCECYTRDKKVLEVAKAVVQAARSEYVHINHGIEEAQKMEKRYKEIQEDITKILEGGRNGK